MMCVFNFFIIYDFCISIRFSAPGNVVYCILPLLDKKKTYFLHSKSVEHVNATPLKIQCSFLGASLATDPMPLAPAGCAFELNDTIPIKKRSVLTGYLYNGHSYGPCGP